MVTFIAGPSENIRSNSSDLASKKVLNKKELGLLSLIPLRVLIAAEIVVLANFGEFCIILFNIALFCIILHNSV